ncbi:histidine kinase [Hydrogenophaga sp.]|uniref:sensor histidine kinase n=1 Tax=Hydrogenophaga sp. TaxID=1904254 RepID=UPI0025C71848|nr:histidine kinase [Hydrogenophaga sp.]
MSPTTTLLRHWLPADTHKGLMRRMLIVWAVALLIALAQWLSKSETHALDRSLVYSCAISTSIWFFTDPVRIGLRHWLHTQAPSYWSLAPRSIAWLFTGVVLGYALGTTIGDAYSGESTWGLLSSSPQRFWGIWLSSLAISLGFLFFFYLREKSLALQRQATEARLRLLETQLEPHMLFNTLANLRALIATEPASAIAMLDRLNDYLRATLRASRSGEAQQAPHTLADEFARLDDYLALMAVRMGPRLQVSLNLPDALASHPLPPLLLQPLVENSIRHGLEPSVAGGELRVGALQQGGHLVLEVRDTGVGFDGAPAEGFGLAQVRERVASAYDGRGRVQFAATPGAGTTVSILLPLATREPMPA